MENYKVLEKQVNSKETFLQFLEAFIADLHDSQEKERQSPSSHVRSFPGGYAHLGIYELHRYRRVKRAWGIVLEDAGSVAFSG